MRLFREDSLCADWSCSCYSWFLSRLGAARSDIPRLDGGGATFIEPLMLKWQRVYEREAGVQVDYTGTGSGNGVQQMTRGASSSVVPTCR